MYKCKKCNEFIKSTESKTKGAFRSYCGCGWIEYTAPYDLWEEVEPENVRQVIMKVLNNYLLPPKGVDLEYIASDIEYDLAQYEMKEKCR